MKINEAFEELYKLKYKFDREIPKMAFELRIVENWDGPFRGWYTWRGNLGKIWCT